MSANLIRKSENANIVLSGARQPELIRSVLILWSVVALGLVWFVFSLGSGTGDRLYLIPWCFAVAIVTLAPVVYLIFRNRFDAFHPLVFPVWTYFFPGFAVGGLVLAFGLSQVHYISYIQDEASNLPLTFLYVIVGFLGLVVGFAFPLARRIGEFVGARLPNWELTEGNARMGGLILLAIGLINVAFAFLFGALGYQRSEEASEIGGIIHISTLFWYQASFLLGLYIFRSRDRTGPFTYAILVFLVLTAVVNALLVGSRGGLFHFILPLLFAFLYSGRKIRPKHYFGVGAIITLALIIGVIYGTTFRGLRETQQTVSIDRYVAVIPGTFEKILEDDPTALLRDGFLTLATRIELVSSLAVVVSNYEALAPYEDELGISNNILVETSTFFVPRVVWTDKPISIEPAKYADLYFNYSENSYTMTPIGDLIRNFGPWGIPIGMFILGMLLRCVYVALVDGQGFSYWKLTLYYLLLTSISYDGTFGGIIPNMFKTAVVASVGFVIVWLITVRLRQTR